jgi:hypothetical protein
MQAPIESFDENAITHSFPSFFLRHWKLISAITTTWTLAGLGVGLGLGFAASFPFFGLGLVVTAPLFTGIGFLVGLIIGVSAALFRDWYSKSPVDNNTPYIPVQQNNNITSETPSKQEVLQLPLNTASRDLNKLSTNNSMPPNNNFFQEACLFFMQKTLPSEILHMIGCNLPTKDLCSMSQVNKFFNGSFHPSFLTRQFLQAVAHGNQDEAELLLKKNPQLMIRQDMVTDYSGRAFHCSAYEYAYWAKDTHMCRMLEKHMDEKTKATMLTRCDTIDKHGLKYSQNGTEYCTSHFDFTPLKEALQNYINGYPNWYNTNNFKAMKAAWMQVGLAQRNVPVHVINEYCRPDRSFDPVPAFKEDKLPRVVTFYNYNYNVARDELLFPLIISDLSGLGVNFAVLRGCAGEQAEGLAHCQARHQSGRDLAAVSRLDEVRTADLTQSRENLKSVEPKLCIGC